MYELILTVMISFPGPVLVLEDGHSVTMASNYYRVAIQGFPNQQDCLNYKGYQAVTLTLTNALGGVADIVPDTTNARCKLQPSP